MIAHQHAAVGVAQQHQGDAGDQRAGDLQQRHAGRRRDQARLAPAVVAPPGDAAEDGDQHQHHDPAGGRAEVGGGDVVDVGVGDADAAAVSEDAQQLSLPEQEPGQRDHERGQADAGDDRSLQQADAGAGQQRGAHRRHQRPAVMWAQRGRHDRRAQAGHEADRQVDLAKQQHEHLGHRQQAEHRRLHQQVDQVARPSGSCGSWPGTRSRSGSGRRSPAACRSRRRGPARSPAGSSRRAESAAMSAGSAASRAAPFGAGSSTVTPSPPRGPRRSRLMAVVILPRSRRSASAWSIRRWSSGRPRSGGPSRRPGRSATTRPRYSTAIRSATSNTSFMLCETSITASPRSASRRTSASTFAVWATPSAAVGSSMITSLVFQSTALAIATDWRWPPDSDATGWRTDRTVVTARLASVSAAASPSTPRPAPGPRAARGPGTCSGRCPGCRTAPDPGTPSRCRARRRHAGVRIRTGLPSQRIWPASGPWMPEMRLDSADLPAPLSPTSAVTSPAGSRG